MDPLAIDRTTPDLVDAWEATLRGFLALAEGLDADQWSAPTPCPGWSVGDLVAHIVDIEQFLAELPRPDHQPDYDALPHVQGDFGKLTEIGVDYRRGHAPADVVAELAAVIPLRRAQLDATPPGTEVMGPMLAMLPVERVLRMRTFDAWVHTQDIRTAIGQDGDWATPGAEVAFAQMASALPYVWGRGVRPPAGATVRVRVTGPDLASTFCAEVGDDGRGRACPEPASPTVDLALSWPDFMRLSCGRVSVDDPEVLSRLTLSGDADLGARLLPALSIAP